MIEIYTKTYEETEGSFAEHAFVLQSLGLNLHAPNDWHTIVEENFCSPYNFGKMLRDAVSDEWAAIYSVGGVYFCLGGQTIAYCKSTTINPLASIPKDATLFIPSKPCSAIPR